MNQEKIRPAWFLLYGLFAILMGALWLEIRADFTPLVHKVLESGLLFFFFGLVAVWLKANEIALLHDELEENGIKREQGKKQSNRKTA